MSGRDDGWRACEGLVPDITGTQVGSAIGLKEGERNGG